MTALESRTSDSLVTNEGKPEACPTLGKRPQFWFAKIQLQRLACDVEEIIGWIGKCDPQLPCAFVRRPE
jgi:hypothetical protein